MGLTTSPSLQEGFSFAVKNAAGEIVAADALPTCVLKRIFTSAGVRTITESAAVVTVDAQPTAGLYFATWTNGAWAEGDLLELVATATIDGDPYTGIVALFDVEVASGGTGARTATITVNDGTTILQNALVRITEGANSYTSLTNVSGVAVFNVDDATYTVSVTKFGYTYAGTTLVVDGTEAETYSMTIIPPVVGSGTPASAPTDGWNFDNGSFPVCNESNNVVCKHVRATKTYYVDLRFLPEGVLVTSATADTLDPDLEIESVTVLEDDVVNVGCTNAVLVAGRAVLVVLSGGAASEDEVIVTIHWLQDDGDTDAKDVRLIVNGLA